MSPYLLRPHPHLVGANPALHVGMISAPSSSMARRCLVLFWTAVSMLLVSLSWCDLAAACPNCAIGRQARSQVWNDDFGTNLLAALLPFAVIGSVCLGFE